MTVRKPLVLVGSVVQELPAGDTLPPQAPAAHSHAIGDVSGLQGALDAKASANSVREKLTSNISFYVRLDGSDSNTGLSNTSGGAFRTIQRSINEAAHRIDLGAAGLVTIYVGVGTFAGAQLRTLVGAGSVLIRGINDNMSDTVIVSGNNGFSGRYTGVYEIRYMRMQCVVCIDVSGPGAELFFGNIDFAQASIHAQCYLGASICVSGDYKISGGAIIHLGAYECGVLRCIGFTVTLVGTPNFTYACVSAERIGSFLTRSTTFVGAATGVRFIADLNGVISVGGVGNEYLPGSLPGQLYRGGQYV